MKDLLKTAAAIQLGIFAAYQHLVGAEYMNVISTSRDKHNNISPGGLRVQIEPSLEFSNDGGLITSINNNDLYTVRLLIEGGEEVNAVSFVRSCYETIAEHSVGLLRKLGCLPIPDFGSDHPNVQRTTASAASEHSGVLRGGDEHVGSSVMANDAQEIHHADGEPDFGGTGSADHLHKDDHVAQPIKQTFQSHSYTVGWRVSGKTLLAWNRTDVLHFPRRV